MTGTAEDAVVDACSHITLYAADGHDREIPVEQIDVAKLAESELLWVDLQGDDPALLDRIVERLQLDAEIAAKLHKPSGQPLLENFGSGFLAQAVAVQHLDGVEFNGLVLTLLAGPNYVLSVHREPIEFLDRFRDRERAETDLGVLSAQSFVASLLDWQISTYFDAVSKFEVAVDRLEISILASRKHRDCLPKLVTLRRAASHLRQMLSSHRQLFNALARPDFRPVREGSETDACLLALDARYERAVDTVENARDLVVGSFELYTSRTAQRTNDNVQMLTFVTILLGSLGVIASVLGMNFPQFSFFATGAHGFWVTIAGMTALSLGMLILARWRGWL